MDSEADIGEAARNLSESLARLKKTTASLGRGMLESLSGSLEAEERRRVAVVAGACASILLLTLAAGFGGFAVIMRFRDTNPALAAACVAATFVLLAGAAAWFSLRQQRRPSPFARAISLIAALYAQYRRVRS